MKMNSILFTLSSAALCACAQPRGETPLSPGNDGRSASAGEVAPQLRLQSRSGAAVDLEDLRGMVVVVDFWASWCDPCRDELPILERFYAAHRESGLEILAVNIDADREDADELLSRLQLSFPVLYDTDQEVVSRWQPPKMPTSYIVDKGGKISAVQAGFEPEEIDALEARLLAQLD
jgi:cytochrome c biogenesis protein CcmG, thiol:disulfide interchange protein DsbE